MFKHVSRKGLASAPSLAPSSPAAEGETQPLPWLRSPWTGDTLRASPSVSVPTLRHSPMTSACGWPHFAYKGSKAQRTKATAHHSCEGLRPGCGRPGSSVPRSERLPPVAPAGGQARHPVCPSSGPRLGARTFLASPAWGTRSPCNTTGRPPPTAAWHVDIELPSRSSPVTAGDRPGTAIRTPAAWDRHTLRLGVKAGFLGGSIWGLAPGASLGIRR